tara:strand:+ start:728 stop:1000 length:273 start_codon:yes stop_codon:yes gene_type:complete
MPAIEDHDYLKLCAKLASFLSISISSARRKVEMQAARDGVRELAGRKEIAENLLNKLRLQVGNSSEGINSAQFDELLAALAEEENFMIED